MKKNMLCLCFGLFGLFSINAQEMERSITLNNGATYKQVSLRYIKNDTLIIISSESVKQLNVERVVSVTETQIFRNTLTGVIIGGLIGAPIGFYYGKEKDIDPMSYRSNEAENNVTANKIKYSLFGSALGGLFGGIIGSTASSKKPFSYDIAGWSSGEKIAFIRKTFNYNEGITIPVNQTELEINQSTQKDSMVEKITKLEEEKNEPKIYIAIGGGFPVGDFGKVDLTSTSGLAKDGISARFAMIFPRTQKFQITAGVNYAVNKVDPTPFHLLSTSVEIDNWKTVTLTLGFQRLYFISDEKNAVYFNGDIGYMFGFSPSIVIGAGSNQIIQASADGSGMAFSVGTGILFNELIAIDVRYQYAKPEYEVSASYGGASITEKYSQSTGIIFATVGIYLGK